MELLRHGFGTAHTNRHSRILVIEVVPHAEEPGAFCLRTPPLALWDTLRESKTLHSGRATCHDLDRAPSYPHGDVRRPTPSHCLFSGTSGLQRVQGHSQHDRLMVLPAPHSAFSSTQQPLGGGIKAQSDHFSARAFQFLASRFKVPRSQWLHPNITFNSD